MRMAAQESIFMADSAGRASITERLRPIEGEVHATAVHPLGDAMAFVLAEEAVLRVAADGAATRIAVHAGGILASAATPEGIATGGDDGTVALTGTRGTVEILATDAKRRWIDRVAAGPAGAIAWSAGKTAHVRIATGEVKTLDLPSSPGGLAFAPKGFRLAAAHYDGVSLWFPNAEAPPEKLEWKGSHLGVAFSPDGKYVVTAMQEPMLHGWRLADGKHMRMSGYAGKVRAMDWTADGKWFATGGSDQLVLWPFGGKDGPMGKQPRMLAPLPARVVAVACHPAQAVAAIGYADGTVLLVRLEDGAEILVRAPDGSSVSALGWDGTGQRLAFATEEGKAAIVTL
jgi:WD40 repeat protein